MKILSDITGLKNAPGKQNPVGKTSLSSSGVKSVNLSELTPGDKFRANIVNISPGSMTLRFENGAVIEAKTRVSPDAHIGDDAIFLVTENFKGQILLEMVKPGQGIDGYDSNQTGVSPGVLREALMNADTPVTAANMELIARLVTEGLPINAETVRAAMFFMYGDAMQPLTQDQIVFLLKEGFPPEKETLESLRAILGGRDNISKELDNLFAALSEMPEGELNDAISRIFSEITENADTSDGKAGVLETTEIPEQALDELPEEAGKPVISRDTERLTLAQVKEKLFANLDALKNGGQNMGMSLKEAGEAYKALHKAVSQVISATESYALPESDKEGIAEAVRAAESIKNQIEFMNNIRNFKEFIRLPFVSSETDNECDLHVFKRKKGARLSGENISALIAMDYPHLNHVEVFINKMGDNVTLQFRAETGKVLNILGSGVYRLADAIAAHGYKLSSVRYKKAEEQFDVTTIPPEFKTSGDGGIKRYSVDIRL